MSGIYLTVWDDVKQFDRVLKPTKGGWPHITLAWTGKNLTAPELTTVAKEALNYWVLHPITLSHARVNTFFHEGEGKERHDVLLIVEEKKEVETSRDVLLRTAFPARQHKFNMMEPHVTAAILWSKEEAEAALAEISEHLPLTVEVNGVTID
jgi:hypothetical protein